MDRRDFLKMTIPAVPALFAGTALVSGCVKPPEPQGELDSSIPFHYLKLAQDFSSFQLYGERQMGQNVRYVLLFGDLALGNPNAMDVDLKSGQATGGYITTNPDGVDDRIMRFEVPLQGTIEKGPCFYQQNGKTFAGFAANNAVYAEFDTPLYDGTADPNTVNAYRRALSNFKMNGDYIRSRFEIGTVGYDGWGQKRLYADPVVQCS